MADDIGKIGWIDMTVENATATRDFYATVVGLKPEDVDMGGYADYTMTMPANGGKLRFAPRGLAGGRFCVMEDPNGAVAALYQP